MKNMKHLGLSLLKQIGLIFLVLNINPIPMRFLLLDADLPIYLEVLLVLLYLVGIFFLVRILWKRYCARLTDEVKSLKIGWKDFGFAFLFFLLGRIIAIVGTLLIFYLSGQGSSANDATLVALGGEMTLAHPLFALLYPLNVAVIVPVIEEIVFRGFGSVLFFKKPVSWLGAVVTSLVFALPHVSSLLELPLYFTLGMVIYGAYARRGSIKDSILVHILNNLPLAIMLLYSLFF